MLVCSCNFIIDVEICDVINVFFEEDCWQLIVFGKVYYVMQKCGCCCGCFLNVVDIIVLIMEEFYCKCNFVDEKVVDFMEWFYCFEEEQKIVLCECCNLCVV